jgi:Ca2+-binding EF-hand superfamily protein
VYCNNIECFAQEYAKTVRDLRRALEELRHEKEISDVKATHANELEEQLAESRQENRNLEDKIARLCETPFISKAFGEHDVQRRLEEAVRENENYRGKLNHLQEAVRTNFSALQSLRQQAAQLREQKEEAEKKAEEMRIKSLELEAGTSMLQDKLRLYSGDDGVDIESLERALTIVKRRSENVDKLPFLEDHENEKLVDIPNLKRKLEEVQLMNLRLSDEVDKQQNMLKLQSGINKDLHVELETLVHKVDKEKRELIQRAQDFEEIALKRLEKIHMLQAQQRQLIYDVNKTKKSSAKGGPAGHMDAIEDAKDNQSFVSESENYLLSQFIEEKQGDLMPDENLLEIWIQRGVLKDGLAVMGSSTCIVIDFFDYESQWTAPLPGPKPEWDFAPTFKIVVDDYMLRFLATGVIGLELNMVHQGDFTLLAKCEIPASALLKAKPLITLKKHPMISLNTGEIIAHVDMQARLALPVSELYSLFVERHPTERKYIEDMSTRRALDSMENVEHAKLLTAAVTNTADEEGRLYNELEILILKAVGLPNSIDKNPPSPYVHFRFLGNPDTVTNVVANSSDPMFNEKFSFSMVTNDTQLRLLQRCKLQLTVLDMRADELNDKNDGLIGEVFVNLSEVSEGLSIGPLETFNIKNEENAKVGELQIAVRWKHTFRKQRELGPNALTAVEVEKLISAFSPGSEREGIVDYKSFCRFVEPPHNVHRIMEKLRSFAFRVKNENNLNDVRDVFRAIFGDRNGGTGFNEDTFVEKLESITQIDDCFPRDYKDLFKFIDLDEDGFSNLDQFIAILNLDEVVGIPTALQEKLRLRSKDLGQRHISCLELFQRADQWGDKGSVTRLEFKNVLKKMGFVLVDDVSSSSGGELLGSRQPSNVSQAQMKRLRGVGGSLQIEGDRDMLNDTMGSEDIIIGNDDEMVNAGYSAANNRSLAERLQVQAKLYEERKSEIEQQKNKAVANQTQQNRLNQQKVASSSSAATASIATAVGVNMLADRDPYPAREHLVGVKGSSQARQRIPDKSETETSATKLQAQFRGHLTRKNTPLKAKPAETPQKLATVSGVTGRTQPPLGGSKETQRVSVKDGVAGARRPSSGSASGGVSNSRGGAIQGLAEVGSSLLSAEVALRNSLRALEGSQPVPDILSGFRVVDAKSTGYVNRSQFAHVMQQFKMIRLHGQHLRVCMDFFDRGTEGTQIDYHAFVQFVRYKEPDLPTPIAKLHIMSLNNAADMKARHFDTSGTGLVKRSDMLRVLAELGYGQAAHSQILEALKLFETRTDGLVNYGNFIEYVKENGVNFEMDVISRQIYEVMAQTSESADSLDDKTIRTFFKKIDVDGFGEFSLERFAEFIRSQGIHCSNDSIFALFNSITELTGVKLHGFATWLRSIPNPRKMPMTAYAHLSLSELQRKATSYMILLASSNGRTLQEIQQSFLIYDWRRPAEEIIEKSLFMNATSRVGFPFTNVELNVLAQEFGHPGVEGFVAYKRFLVWATPDVGKPGRASQDRDARASASQDGGRSLHSVKTFLEKALHSGVDLLSVFRRYDAMDVGRLTPDQFCAAMADIGLSTVSKLEALNTAERFKAVVGDFILYRQLVRELLKHEDEVTKAHDIDAVDAVRSALLRSQVTLNRLREVFDYYDNRKAGKIAIEDLARVFEEARVRVHRNELNAIANRYPAGNGLVGFVPLLQAVESRMGDRTAVPSQFAKYIHLPSELPSKIRSWFEHLIIRGREFRSEFDQTDEGHVGSIVQAHFREVLQDRLKAGFSAVELAAIESAYRDNRDPRKVDYIRFIYELHPRYYGVEDSSEPVWMVAERLRQKIRRNCEFFTDDLRRSYFHFSRKKDTAAAVSFEDFAVALRELQMKLAGDQERALFDQINLTRGKEFHYTDFVVFVRDPLHLDVVWKFRRLVGKTKVSEKELINALSDQDTNASGMLTRNQFSKALGSLHLELSGSDIARLLQRFDTEETQTLDIEKFILFVKGQSDGEKQALRSSTSSVRRSTDSSIETAMFRALKRVIEKKLAAGFTANEVFAAFDTNRTGTVDLRGLQEGARELGVSLERNEARSVMRRLVVLVGEALKRDAFFDALNIDEDLLDQASAGGRSKRDSRDSRPQRRYVQDDDQDDVDEETSEAIAARRRRRKLREADAEELTRPAVDDRRSSRYADDDVSGGRTAGNIDDILQELWEKVSTYVIM